ncbi:hypothetical protein C8R45DRAFT_299279 [Mycena sanguinolenta]|nr:hypothetical protein C8R45DRAFT_299279 [Mycena sanguinolenta]
MPTDGGKYQRNRLNSEMGIIDATTLILLQKMMADSYEHGRVVWKENRARCARTGQAESDELPCEPNSAQKKAEAWLVETGLLAPDDDGTPVCPPESPMSPTPQCPRRRSWPWHRRLEIVIPRKSDSPKRKSTNSKSFSSASTSADSASTSSEPGSPLSPIKLWSAVAAIPVTVVRLKPKPTRTELSPPPAAAAAVERPVRSLENVPVPVLVPILASVPAKEVCPLPFPSAILGSRG